MGQQIIKQPDGQYALFSSVQDTFIMIDATREDVIEHFGTQAKEEAERRVAGIIDRLEAGERPYYQFTMTWAARLSW